MLAEQMRTIRENAREAAELKAKVAGIEQKVNNPPPPPTDPKVEAKKFYDDPMGGLNAMAEKIKKDLEATVKPIIEFKDSYQKESAYIRLKETFKNDSRFKEFLGQPGVEGMVDMMMEKLPASNDAMVSVLSGLRGSMELGLVPKPGGQPNPSPTPPRNDPVNPPHLRPTPPPLPEGQEKRDAHAAYVKSEVEKLDENARRLIRENGQTPEEYIAWRDLEAEMVAHSKLGLKEPEPKGAAK